MALADLERNDWLLWRRPQEVWNRLIAEAEALGANTVLLHFDRGALSHAMGMEELQHFGTEVLPALQAHQGMKVLVVGMDAA